MYLDSSSTHVDNEACLVNLGASLHITPHKEWFGEYGRYDGDDVFLGDDSTAKIIGRGKFKLKLMDGKIRTLLGVLHIPGLALEILFL